MADILLEDVMTSEESREDLDMTVRMVVSALFSQFPERKIYALRGLHRLYEEAFRQLGAWLEIEVRSEEHDGIYHAYIRFNPMQRWALVGKYIPGGEEIPLFDEEIAAVRTI